MGLPTPPLPPVPSRASQDETACQARAVLSRIGDKWSLNVVYQLARGPMRFTELKRAIDGISQRMLTATVRSLERDGLVSRTVHPVVPPRVDYELTALGATLLDTICRLMAWTMEHLDDIEQARKEYDNRQVTAAGARRASVTPGYGRQYSDSGEDETTGGCSPADR